MRISKEDRELIEASRKYGIRLYTLKIDAFMLFDMGYLPTEVAYLLDYENIDRNLEKFKRTIRRYHFDWKKAQKLKN